MHDIELHHELTIGYRELATAVIQKAVFEARHYQSGYARDSARRFLRDDDGSLSLWCKWLDLSPDAVREAFESPPIKR